MNCEECGKEFLVWPYIIQLGKGHFCSSTCRKLRASDKLKGVRKRENIIFHLDSYCVMVIVNKRGEFYVIFDKEDFELLNKHTWSIGLNGYACTNTRHGIRQTMHRLIMNTPDGMDTDHISGIKLDNRKMNLRVCTTAENTRNVSKRENRRFKGVNKTPNNTYQAKVGKYYLGAFPTEELAAKAYNEGAKKHFGEFAKPNEI